MTIATKRPTEIRTAAQLRGALNESNVRVLLAIEPEPVDVTALTIASGMSQQSVSLALRPLRALGMVETDRDGSRRVNSLSPLGHAVLVLLREMAG